MKTFTLNDGAKMPAFGLGTMSWQSSGKPGDVAHAVEHALRDGYDLIDAAWFYQNEGTVGEGIKASGRKREDIYVTTKVWGTVSTANALCHSSGADNRIHGSTTRIRRQALMSRSATSDSITLTSCCVSARCIQPAQSR